jgi:hypothetical protein
MFSSSLESPICYEPPHDAEIVLDTTNAPVTRSAKEVVEFLAAGRVHPDAFHEKGRRLR